MDKKIFARIERGMVAELLATDHDIGAMFHPDLLWVEVSGEAQVAYGWTYGDGLFAPPAPSDTEVAPTPEPSPGEHS